MSNFDFLLDSYPSIFQKMKIAESRVFTEPKSAAHYTRLALEEAVHFIYREEYLEMPYDTKLASLMREEEFRHVIPSSFTEGLYIVRPTLLFVVSWYNRLFQACLDQTYTCSR